MTNKEFFQITGLQEGLGKLYGLRRQISSVATQVALDMLYPVQQAAIQQAPKATGKLAGGIMRRRWKKAGIANVGTRRTKYGAHVELGIKGREPDAFMMRAYDIAKDQAKRIAITEMGKHIKRILG